MARSFSTFLMFDGSAEEAVNFYASVFKDCVITQMTRYEPGDPALEGRIRRATFTLGGHAMIAFDTPIKHAFTFTPSISIAVECENEAELDAAFNQLSAGGQVLMEPNNYGFSEKFAWLKDRFGVSWQLNLA